MSLEQLIASLVKDEGLRRKVEDLLSRRAPDGGLKDSFSFSAAGHIRVEKYDADGRVLEVIDQPNLIVNTARDMLIKALAGEPTKLLWKEPRVTNIKDPNTLYYVLVYSDSSPPPALYRNVYFVSTYLPDDVRYEKFPGGNRGSSVYKPPVCLSTDTVTFMALGDGAVNIANDIDPHLLYSGDGWQRYDDPSLIGGSLHATSAAGDSVEFKFKGSAVEVYSSKGLDGAIMEVWLDGQRLDDIDLFDSTSSVFGANAKRSQRFVIATGLDANTIHTLVLKHSGTKNPSAASPAYINIEALGFDGYFEDATGLAREIRSQVSVFEAPEVYNTSPNAPYVISLLHPPLKAGTEKVFYRDSQLTKAAGNTAPLSGQYQYVLDAAGKIVGLQFAEQLTGVSVSYESENSYATGYKRALIERPTSGPSYPYYNYNEGTVTFVAEFPPGVPNYSVYVRELGLFNGPRPEDGIEGWGDEVAKPFSLARISPILKTPDTGLRVTWTIVLNLVR